MIGRIRFIPLAAESYGVRSMCTYIETPDIKILVDPGVSLGPRFGFLPHPREYACLQACRKRIMDFAKQADIITISHYHLDHYTPTFTDYVWTFSDIESARQIYTDKTILTKDFRRKVNPSQRRRGWLFKRSIRHDVNELTTVDNQQFVFNNTLLEFSRPVPHGEANTPLGWVLMLTVEYDDIRVIHASDVQGPISDKTLDTLLAKHPTLVYAGGPPLYLLQYRLPANVIERGLTNARKLVTEVPTVILDHHLLRDKQWHQASTMIFDAARNAGHHVATAASFVGETDNNLESQRRTLYDDNPPPKAFKQWAAQPETKRRYKKPPI